MRHAIQIGDTLILQSDGTPVLWGSATRAAVAKEQIQLALLSCETSARNLPRAFIVAVADKVAPHGHGTSPKRRYDDQLDLPLTEPGEAEKQAAREKAWAKFIGGAEESERNPTVGATDAPVILPHGIKRSPLAAEHDAENEANYSDLQVLKSGAGWYIGTIYTHPPGSDMPGLIEPGTRDSYDYYAREEEARAVFERGDWVQRQHP